MTLLDHCPAPPDWTVPWATLRATYDWVEVLHDCPQDAVFHAEGDVGIHTEMALKALAATAEFRELPLLERQIVFAAVLLHDVAKPACTRTEDGRITSRGHSSRGEMRARQLLWRQAIPFECREAICGLIRHHQVPFFLVDRPDSQKLAYGVSQVARCDHLALVALADGTGRRCQDPADQQRILENVELFREYCREHECLSQPRAFASDHSRFLYFQKDTRDPSYHAHDDTMSEVILMSGLPGSGKDHWIERSDTGLPVVSLDSIRRELGVSPAAPQGEVVREARERAKIHLRRDESFIWNATNVTRQMREQLVALFTRYNARTHIVYVEAAAEDIERQNSEREHAVPSRVLARLINKWSVPTVLEAQRVSTIIGK